jgi:hypothetical protein
MSEIESRLESAEGRLDFLERAESPRRLGRFVSFPLWTGLAACGFVFLGIWRVI